MRIIPHFHLNAGVLVSFMGIQKNECAYSLVEAGLSCLLRCAHELETPVEPASLRLEERRRNRLSTSLKAPPRRNTPKQESWKCIQSHKEWKVMKMLGPSLTFCASWSKLHWNRLNVAFQLKQARAVCQEKQARALSYPSINGNDEVAREQACLRCRATGVHSGD